MDNSSFTKLYNSCVRPILEYGSELWGHRSYKVINAVYNKACRVLLSVQRQAPSLALSGETGWIHPQVRQDMTRSRLWIRLAKFSEQRMAHRVFSRCKTLAESGRSNWCKRVLLLFNSINMQHLINIENCIQGDQYNNVKNVLNVCKTKYEEQWLKDLHNDEGRNNGSNKLRH